MAPGVAVSVGDAVGVRVGLGRAAATLVGEGPTGVGVGDAWTQPGTSSKIRINVPAIRLESKENLHKKIKPRLQPWSGRSITRIEW